MLLEEIAKVKQEDPESLLVFDLNIKEYYDNEKFEDCAQELEKRIKLHGEDETTWSYKILLLIHDNKYDDLVKAAEQMYQQYPANAKLLPLMYNIKKDVYKDQKAALKVYENFLKSNYNYDVYSDYATKLTEQGNTGKALDVKQKLVKLFPFDPSGLYTLCNYFFSAKQYDKAEDCIKKAMALSPYNENYWEKLGDIRNEKNDVSGALAAYSQSLKYDPNQYNLISKIRKLNGQT